MAIALSRLSPRTRSILHRFAMLVSVNIVVLAVLMGLVYRDQATARLAELERSEERAVALQGETLVADFQAVVSDLMTLAENGVVRGLFADRANPEWDAIAWEFKVLAEKKQVYDQVRLLDAKGMELVRVNLVDGRAQVVPPEKLQDKGDRYYFQAAVGLSLGEVFVSPLDLNVEDGRIEQPLKPTVRFATPLADAAGVTRGVLILNYLTTAMFQRFARLGADTAGEAMLVNSEGYWLYAGDPRREFGFMYPDRVGTHFPRDYPSVWPKVLAGERGQLREPQGLFTFATVYPLSRVSRANPLATPHPGRDGTPYQWKIVSRVPSETIAGMLWPLRQALAILAGTSVVLLVAGSLAVARNATDRELSERSLRESEGRFRQMADAIAEVFWLRTADCQELMYVSPAFATVWGRTPSSLSAATAMWWEGIHPEDRPRVASVFREGMGQGEFSLEYRVVRPCGEIRWILDRGFAVRDEQGALLRFAGIADDISDLREAQERLLRNERLAAMGEAITGLAHESRNALQRGQACLEMLSKRIADQPDASALAARLQEALRDLYRLYDRLRVYAGPMQVDRAPCDLRALWRRTCEDLAELIHERGALVTEECPPDLDTRLMGDDLAIRQVFRNIVENALSVELDGRVARQRIDVSAVWSTVSFRGQPALEMVVRDNGPGAPPEHLARLFEPFFSTKMRGTGLGLAISRRIVEAHGGQIEAFSEPGRGLAIHIVLPRGAP